MRFSLVFYLGDFRFHRLYQLSELFLAFLSCLGVYVLGYAFAAHSRCEPSFAEVVAYHGDDSRAGVRNFTDSGQRRYSQ